MTYLAGARIEASLTLVLAIVHGGQQASRQYFVALRVKVERYHQAADNCRLKEFDISESSTATLYHWPPTWSLVNSSPVLKFGAFR